MNKAELKQALDKNGTNPRYYTLDGFDDSLFNDIFVLDNIDGQWLVYYLEQGEKKNVHVFDSEEEACRFLYNWMISAPGNRTYHQHQI
jgi:hypothetical protein